MNPTISQLYKIAKKPEKIILGLMSGTSLDGLDMALCKISGNGINTKVEILNFETVLYAIDFKEKIKQIFCKEKVSLEFVCLMNSFIGLEHSKIINNTLINWEFKNSDVDLIASHGQTIYHSPKSKHNIIEFGNSTFQIGDADQIAVNTGIITISDFRQKHIAFGGEGSPLAIYGDYFLFSSIDENRILLNIGGISNFTYLPKNLNVEEVFCTDIGPGNTLMDIYINHHFSEKFYDENAEIAIQGIVNTDFLRALINHEFFKLPFPKTTGQEVFNFEFIENAMSASDSMNLNSYDVMATLNYFTATIIVDGITKFLAQNNLNKNQADCLVGQESNHTLTKKNYSIYISGGGFNNPLLIKNIKEQLPNIKIESSALLGIHPNAKEAVLFAILANECISSDSEFYKNINNNFPSYPVWFFQI